MHIKPELKSLLYSGVLFVSLFFLADRVIGYYLKDLYQKQKKGVYFDTTYALKHAKEDVLIFGSSRAVRHYDPQIIEDSLKLSAYNVGKLGNTLLYSDAVFSQVLTRYKPKVVVLDISPIEFAKSERERGQKSMMDVLLKYHELPVIAERIRTFSKRDLMLAKIFWTYEFNSTIYTMLIGDSGPKKPSRSKGFSARKGSKVAKHYVEEENRDYEEDSLMVKTFRSFLEKARKNNVEVYVVISPTTLKQSHTSVAKIKAITKEFGFNFIDVSFRPEFRLASLYYDPTHLNEVGAKKFSELMGDTLKNARILLANKI